MATGGFACTQPVRSCNAALRSLIVATELAAPTPSKFAAVTAVLSVDCVNAASLLAVSVCHAVELAIIVAVPAAPGPTRRR